MTPEEQKNRTAELFHEALTRGPDQQSAFLRDACAGDEGMFRKVKGLLDAYSDVRTASSSSAPSGTFSQFVLDPDALLAIDERYENIELLGQGGMGIVFRARDRELNKVVALKMLHPGLARDERVIKRFKNEIRLALDITHKNVCRTYGLERFDGTMLISMEYVEGETLRSILDRAKGVSVPQGLRWATEICEALAAAHDKKVVHRDLKPENVMVDRYGHVKVMDFGIARSIEEAANTAGTIIGTPKYMSPEQALGRTVEPTSDIYSLGLVLYEMFTGVARDPANPLPPSEVNPYLPGHIDRAIRRCLQDDPRERFQSVNELKLALTSNQGVVGAEASIALAGSRRRRQVVGVAVACAVLLVVLVGLLMLRNNRQMASGMRHERLNTMVFSPDGRTLASSSEDKTIKLWDVRSQREKLTLTGHEGTIETLAFSADGRWLASGGGDRTIRIWEVGTGKLSRKPFNLKQTVAIVALSPDGRWLASVSDTDTVRIWDLQMDKELYAIKREDTVNAVTFSPNGSWLASGGEDGVVRVWEVETGRPVSGPLHHDGPVTTVAFNRDGWLASGSRDKTIKLWSPVTWHPVDTLSHEDSISELSFNRDGLLLASWSNDSTVRIWEVPSGKKIAMLTIEDCASDVVTFSPDLDYLAVGDTAKGVIRLKDLTTMMPTGRWHWPFNIGVLR